MFKPILILTLLITFFIQSCKKDEAAPAQANTPTVVATEKWESLADSGLGTGNWTFTKKSDGTISADGLWQYGTVTCPFTDGTVTLPTSDSLFFTGAGTATNSSAPAAYQSSVFVLKSWGNTKSGTYSGKYEVTFSTPGWAPLVTGKVTATRKSGSGITN